MNTAARLFLLGLFCCELAALEPRACAQGGVPLWTNFFGGFIAISGNGNVFLGGTLSGSSATIAYSTDGVPLWTNLNVSGPIAVDGSGNLFAFDCSSRNICSLMKYSSKGSSTSSSAGRLFPWLCHAP